MSRQRWPNWRRHSQHFGRPMNDWLSDWGFEFEGEDERWMARLQLAEEPLVLGRIGEYELQEEVARGG